jgi:hypothetical protein
VTANKEGVKRVAEKNSKPDFETLLRSVENLIEQKARLASRGDKDVQERLAQVVRIRLWKHTYKHFDPNAGMKWSTYCYKAIGWVIANEMKKIRRTPIADFSDGTGMKFLEGKNHRLDRKIEGLSDDVLRRPEKYLTKRQAEALAAWRDHPGADQATLAKILGIKQVPTLCNLLKRVRQRIGQISIEDFNPENT